MRRFLLCVLLVLATSGAIAAEPRVDRATDALVDLLRDAYASEYKPDRRIHRLDDSSWLVFFSIESFGLGNNLTQYAALFRSSLGEGGKPLSFDPKRERHPNKLQLFGYAVIGATGLRLVDFEHIQIEAHGVGVNTREYGPGDPMSTPSVPGRLGLAWTATGLQVVENGASK